MVLDYKKLKAEFEEIKKKEKKVKTYGEGQKVIFKSCMFDFDLEQEEEDSEEARKQKYWEYLSKQFI